MTSPTTTALLAAASAPDLTQNAALGLNRSAASGARMRTVPPIAAAHNSALGTNTSGSGSGKRGLWEGYGLQGNVPVPMPVPALSSQPTAAEPLARTRPPLVAPSLAPFGASNASPPVIISSSSDPFCVSLCHRVVRAGTSGGHVSARPLRVVLHLSITNVTRLRIGPGVMSVSLQLGGPLVFARSSVTSALILSTASRGGLDASAAAVGGGAGSGTGYSSAAGMGAAASGGALSGDLLQLQRGSNHHATHSLSVPLPPDATLCFDVEVAVSGFGTSTVRVGVTADGVDAGSVNAAADESGEGARLAKVTKSIGVSALERWSPLADSMTSASPDGDEDGDIDWSGVGTASGGCASGWGRDLELGAAPSLLPMGLPDPDAEPSVTSASASSLLWVGPGLSAIKVGRRRQAAARYLQAQYKPTKRILVTRQSAGSAGLADFVDHVALGGRSGGGADVTSSSSGVGGLFGSARAIAASGTPGKSGGGGSSAASRRFSAFYSGSSAAGGGDDDASTGTGGGGLRDDDDDDAMDDAATTATGEGAEMGGEDEDGEEGGGAGGEGEATAAFSHKRPYGLVRLDTHSELYRLPAVVTSAILTPLALPPSWPLALALALGRGGCDTQSSVGRADGLLLACLVARLPYNHYACARVHAPLSSAASAGRDSASILLRRVLASSTGGVWASVPCQPGCLALVARTAAGGTIAVVLSGLSQPPPLSRIALSLHTDDARLRAALVGDGGLLAETLSALSARLLTLEAHSNEPALVPPPSSGAAEALVTAAGLQAVAPGSEGLGGTRETWVLASAGDK